MHKTIPTLNYVTPSILITNMSIIYNIGQEKINVNHAVDTPKMEHQ